jgi:hypothetical protein
MEMVKDLRREALDLREVIGQQSYLLPQSRQTH